jgi:UDP-N-acetylmuramyl pentapeptide phosphotransferase/UDP-N-acetylglucosamine-1-phosphate transferase
MSVLIASFLLSLLVNYWLIRYQRLHAHFTSDTDMTGVQKFHSVVVPRIGGIGIILGVAGALILRLTQNVEAGLFGILLIVSSLPTFFSGLLEDITKKIGIKIRLLSTIISAGLAGYLLNALLSSVQVLGIDNLMLVYPLVAIFITLFAVTGVANSFNIIDGYNGLSAMVAVIILFAIAYVAFQVKDHLIMISSFAMIGALLGFLVWNYPRGLIFLGDGGAYLIGFWIAELSILLTARHPEVSKWFPFLLCLYPIFETLFTIYRRLILKGAHPGMPDATHLHQLIFRRLVRWRLNSNLPLARTQRNSLTSPYLWILSLAAVLPATLFWRDHIVLKLSCLFFVVFYIWLYRAILHFRVPKWLIIEMT